MASGYMIEVIKYIGNRDENGNLREGITGVYEHVGYMEKLFATRKGAINYYDKHNPHMRSINAHRVKLLKSDWDPETKLAYVIRDYVPINRDVKSW